jgi:regulator of replication initiation timing
VPEDAPNVFDDLKDFFEYLRRIDQIVEANMRGFETLATEELFNVPILPMEPCTVSEGIVNHVRFRQSILERLGNYPVGMDQDIPEIIRDEEMLRDHANWNFHNDNPNHLYISQEMCTELRVRQFTEQLYNVALLFRMNINRMIEQREQLTAMTDIFGGERVVRKKLNKKLEDETFDLSREINFVFQNKLQMEERLQNFHFSIEALRLQLLNMMDELIARRMGWGYAEKNPGHKFMVFVRHTPIVPSFVWPTRPATANDQVTKNPNSKGENKRPKRALVKNLRCIVTVDSVDQLSKLMHKDKHLDFQIFHFVEEENKLKLKIENLKDIFNSWNRVSHGYYKSNYYNHLYDVVYKMFHNFLIDILLNTRYNTITKKDLIISQFKTLILKEMDYSINWYWDPTASANRIKSYINTLYENKYPKKPPQQQIPFHSEL